MKDIRCKKCGKLLAKIEYLGDARNYTEIEIQCPHNYRNQEKRNVQCKMLNTIVV